MGQPEPDSVIAMIGGPCASGRAPVCWAESTPSETHGRICSEAALRLTALPAAHRVTCASLYSGSCPAGRREGLGASR